jgi:rhodanese-related sulfurtransferase
MKSASELGLILGLSLLAGIGNWLADGRPSPDPLKQIEQAPLAEGEIAVDEAPAPGTEGVVWVDARRESQWRADGVPGSIHLSILSEIPLEEQVARHADVLLSARQVIVYCDDLHCGLSHDLVSQLVATGLFEGIDFRVLHGGATVLRDRGLLRAATPAP